MEAAIETEFGDAEIEIVRGSGGIFEVQVDGKVIFDKRSAGRFPEAQEILDKLSARRA